MISLPIGLLLLVAPFFASAATESDIQTQIMFTLGRIAALKAQSSNLPVACAVVASKSSVAVGESFALIWNSFGAKDPLAGGTMSQWARGGISTVHLDAPGTYEYKFVFNGVSGSETTCTARISVRS